MSKLKIAIIIAVSALILSALASVSKADGKRVGSNSVEINNNATFKKFIERSKKLVVMWNNVAEEDDLEDLKTLLNKKYNLLNENRVDVASKARSKVTHLKRFRIAEGYVFAYGRVNRLKPKIDKIDVDIAKLLKKMQVTKSEKSLAKAGWIK